jgi:hypothetical protein
MKIELLLHHVSQDQRAPTGQSAFYGWMHGPSSGGTGGDDKRKKNKPKPKAPDQPPPTPASNYIFRKESWGGILICMSTQNVYVADGEAFDKLTLLNDEGRLAEVISMNLSSEMIDVERLEQMLAADEIA